MRMKPQGNGRRRVIVESVAPHVDNGRYPVKRVLGETVVVEADVFADGHDVLSAVVQYRRAEEPEWTEVEMEPLGNDRWRASFIVESLGLYEYAVTGWVDHFKSWRRDLEKKAQAGQDVSVDLLTGIELVRGAMARKGKSDAATIEQWLRTWESPDREPQAARVAKALDAQAARLVQSRSDRSFATRSAITYQVRVDPVRARTGAWYELFPRSCNSDGRRHGTLKDVELQLPRIAQMGFDVLYLPPIHPIGKAFRKGKNNSTVAAEADPGSPWAIGGESGGHKAVHPDLGTLDDVRRLVRAAESYGIQLALDIALQCSPDHPYVREHPEWFKKRPDGSIQYAENPPKKYQDIYPFDFECEAWESLWEELRSVMAFWATQGVGIFRVDNPHTKAFPFWEWAIGELKAEFPHLIFLSEAFTRPKVMYGLAKLGFTQSYNYFPWRNTSEELRQFMTELTRTSVKEFYRPNLWPNTPDILPQYLQFGGRPGFMVRLVLAATLGASYGIYGPAFELSVNAPFKAGGEEYLDSEKYELKAWNLDDPQSLQGLIARINSVRRENPALHANELIAFHPSDNDQLLVYSKRTDDRSNLILVAVNLDPHRKQGGFVELSLEELGVGERDTFEVHDLLGDSHYLWRGKKNYVELDPQLIPAAVFKVKRHVRTEQDFDYFM